MNEKMRTFEIDGKKRGVRLDAQTWEAVDWLADQTGKKWAELARRWVSDDPQDAEINLTAVIRSGITAELLARELRPHCATATAEVTNSPSMIRVDWVTGASKGNFLLDAPAAEKLARTLEIAQVQMQVLECPDSEPERLERLTKLAGKLFAAQYAVTPPNQIPATIARVCLENA